MVITEHFSDNNADLIHTSACILRLRMHSAVVAYASSVVIRLHDPAGSETGTAAAARVAAYQRVLAGVSLIPRRVRVKLPTRGPGTPGRDDALATSLSSSHSPSRCIYNPRTNRSPSFTHPPSPHTPYEQIDKMAVEKNTTQRVALITGCSEPNSIGANLALDLLRRGWKVYATARKVETLAPLKAEGAQVLALDVVDKLSIADVKQTIFDAEGRLDALVNNVSSEGSELWLSKCDPLPGTLQP